MRFNLPMGSGRSELEWSPLRFDIPAIFVYGLVVLAFALQSSGTFAAPAEDPLPRQPVTVYVGLHLYAISDVDLTRGTYRFHGYLWFRWKGELAHDGPPFNPDVIEFILVNGELEEIDEPRTDREGDWHRQSRKFSARLRSQFDLHRYPFDGQNLKFILEHRWLGTDALVFAPDDKAYPAGTLGKRALDDSVAISNWEILRDEVSHRTFVKTYETNFGTLEDHWNQKGSRYVFNVPVRRNIVSYLTKFLIPLTIIVLTCFSVFFIHCREFEPQVGIVVTVLLSCIAFHISQTDSLPKVGHLVMADAFFFLSYVVIFLSMVEVIVANLLMHRNRVEQAERLDKICRYAFPLLYFLPVTGLIVWGVFLRG